MPRLVIFLMVLTAVCLGCAQQPQVSVNVDLWPTLRMVRDGESIFRWYDDFGHHSTVSVTLLTEVGFHAFVSQRVQRIQDDPDNEFLNEYYLEDTGYWRVGKQLLPFGSMELEREYVRAARADTTLAFGGWPLRIAWCDGGAGRPTGLVARVGEAFGLSVADGEHFGISGTAFNEVRRPEESLPEGAGYRQLLGADMTQSLGRWLFLGEWVRARSGHTGGDLDNDFGLVRVTYRLPDRQNVSLTWGRDVGRAEDSYRLRVRILAGEGTWFIPQVRWRGGRLMEAAAGLHVEF